MEKEKENKTLLLKIFSFIFKLLYYIVIAFVCLVAIFLLYYIISSQIHAGDENYKPKVSIYTIVSPSMTPNINVYDVVVNVRVDSPKDIQVGDIITYKSTATTSEGMTITHRVIAREQLPDGTYEYMTQGDNNPEPDSVYVTYENVIGKEIITIPYLGKLQFLIANQKGWLFLLLIPITIYLVRELFKLVDLLGLRRKVDRIVGTREDSLIDKKKAEKAKQEELKEKLQEERINIEIEKASKIRSDQEQNGFLEKYNETILVVKENKYQKDKKKEEIKTEIAEEIVEKVPTKVDVNKVVEVKEEKKEEITLPKEKAKPIVMVNDQYEVLGTNDLSDKIKEYDNKIEKLDKMIKDIQNIKEESKPEVILEEQDDFLQGEKIKVTKIEETKNKKRSKNTTVTKKIEVKKETKKNNINLELTGIIPIESKTKTIKEEPKVKKEEPKEIVKTTSSKQNKKLNLNPKDVKKINRKTKSDNNSNKKNTKKLNLNPKQVKKVNRPNKKRVENTQPKKSKKTPLIVIEKKK